VSFFDVEVKPPLGGGTLLSSIDFPRSSTRLYGNELDIAGWAMTHHSPTLAVDACAAGGEPARALPTMTRPDVAAAYPEVSHAATSSFYLVVSVPEAAEVDVPVSIALPGGTDAEAGVVRLTRRSSHGWPPANAPLVSIVIACYNQAEFLHRAIESARQQTYPRTEIIVVDDGSTDGSAGVASEHGVHCVRQANRGPAAARNRGLQECTGEFVVFLDADDRLLPHGVEANVDAFMARPDAALVSGWGRRAYDAKWEPPRVPPDGDLYTAILEVSYGFEHQEMLRRDSLIALGGYDESESLRATEDWDLHLRVVREQPAYVHQGGPIYEYRQQSRSLSVDSDRMVRACFAALRRQRRLTRRDPALRSAYDRGVAAIRGAYGDPLGERLAHAVQDRKWREALRAARSLARFHPRGLLLAGNALRSRSLN
jgi:glycosyltransferase involved in cell wall biosynthesis